MLEHGALVSIGSGRIVLAFEPGSFLVDQLKTEATLALIGRLASACLGAPTELELERSGKPRSVATLAERRSDEESTREAEAKKRVTENPLVRAAIEVLGAELRDVRLVPRTS